MPPDALRSIYLATGVLMAPGTLSTLAKLNTRMNALEASTHAVARNMALIRGQTAAMTTAANQVSTAYGRQATAMARVANAQAAVVATNPMLRGRSPSRNGLITQSVGLGTGFALLNFARTGTTIGADVGRQALLASFASQGTMSRRQALRETSRLSSDFRTRPGDSARLLREVEQLGLPGGAVANTSLARAAASFTILNPEVASTDAAAGLGRLIRSTTSSESEFVRGAMAAERYASAIQLAGINSAAGAGAVFDMVRELQPLNQFMRLGAGGTIALAAAFGDLNEEQRELFRGALTRMALEGKIDPDNPVASLLAIAARLRGAQSEQEKVDIMKSLGFDNIRDVQTLSVIAIQMEKISALLPQINDELYGTGNTLLGTQSRAALRDAQGSLDGIGAALDRIRASASSGAAPALALVASALEGIAAVLEKHPLLAAFLLGTVAFAGAKALWGFSGAGKLLGGLGGAMGGRFLMGASRAGGFLGPGGAGAAGAFGSLKNFGGGIMGLLGGRAGGALAGRLAVSAGGGAALSATGVGAILLALGLLAPLFSRLGHELDRLGERGGILGFIFESLGAALKILAFIGNAVNTIFGTIWKWLTKIAEVFHINDLFSAMARGADWIGDQFVPDAKGGKTPGSAPPSGPGTTLNVTVSGGNSQAVWAAAMQRAAVSTARSPVTMSSGGGLGG